MAKTNFINSADYDSIKLNHIHLGFKQAIEDFINGYKTSKILVNMCDVDLAIIFFETNRKKLPFELNIRHIYEYFKNRELSVKNLISYTLIESEKTVEFLKRRLKYLNDIDGIDVNINFAVGEDRYYIDFGLIGLNKRVNLKPYSCLMDCLDTIENHKEELNEVE